MSFILFIEEHKIENEKIRYEISLNYFGAL